MKYILIALILGVFSCKVTKNLYAYRVGEVLVYNNTDSVMVLKLEMSPDRRPMYLTQFLHTPWKLEIEEDFLQKNKHK